MTVGKAVPEGSGPPVMEALLVGGLGALVALARDDGVGGLDVPGPPTWVPRYPNGRREQAYV